MSEPATSRRALDEGLRHLSHERIAESVEALREATTEDPTDPAAQAFLAAALFAAGDAHAAEVAIDRALALDPGGFWPHLKAGELRFRLGDAEAAESHFLVALRAVEPGTRESMVAADALVRARKATSRSIAHRAILPARLHRLLGRRPSPVGVATGEAHNSGP